MSEIQSSGDMVENICYLIYGSVVTTTRAFGKVEVNVNNTTKRIFVKVHLRKYVKFFPKINLLKKAWIARAEDNSKEFLPENWKMLVYYER